jgi:hypothetical protein
MLIIWRIGKLIDLWTDVDESWYTALYGQNKIVYAKKSLLLMFLMAANLHNLSPC